MSPSSEKPGLTTQKTSERSDGESETG